MFDRVIRAAHQGVVLAGLLLQFVRRAIRWRSVSLARWAFEYERASRRCP